MSGRSREPIKLHDGAIDEPQPKGDILGHHEGDPRDEAQDGVAEDVTVAVLDGVNVVQSHACRLQYVGDTVCDRGPRRFGGLEQLVTVDRVSYGMAPHDDG